MSVAEDGKNKIVVFDFKCDKTVYKVIQKRCFKLKFNILFKLKVKFHSASVFHMKIKEALNKVFSTQHLIYNISQAFLS